MQFGSDVEVNIQLLQGSPAVELPRLIRKLEISLAVMGTQGRGFANELLTGNISHNIARNSKASVLLIPAKKP